MRFFSLAEDSVFFSFSTCCTSFSNAAASARRDVSAFSSSAICARCCANRASGTRSDFCGSGSRQACREGAVDCSDSASWFASFPRLFPFFFVRRFRSFSFAFSSASASARSASYVCSIFSKLSANCWQTFREARSRLYQRRFLQVNNKYALESS